MRTTTRLMRGVSTRELLPNERSSGRVAGGRVTARGISAGVASFALALAAMTLIACAGGGDARHDAPVTGPTTPSNDPFTPRFTSCGTSTALMSVSPVAYADLLGWVPLGNMSPPGHLFPTDHQYLYINKPGDPSSYRQVNVVAPGKLTITLAHRTHYSNSNTYDYALSFALCDEVRGEFGHVTTLTPDLLQELGAFDQQCASYGLGLGTDVTFTSCYTKPVAIERLAGQPIGTTGGQGTSFALDFMLHDTRKAPATYANQARWQSSNSQLVYAVAASDYFREPARSEIRNYLGNYNGSEKRTIEPVGGEIAYDVPGTLRGVWINPMQPTFPDGSHMAVVPDPINPTRTTVSLGQYQPDYPAGLYQYLPRGSGYVNREAAEVVPDGQIYCFEFGYSLGVLLMRLEDASAVRVEGRSGITTCAEQEPWAFTGKSFVYVR